jgi:hypothetical protein
LLYSKRGAVRHLIPPLVTQLVKALDPIASEQAIAVRQLPGPRRFRSSLRRAPSAKPSTFVAPARVYAGTTRYHPNSGPA